MSKKERSTSANKISRKDLAEQLGKLSGQKFNDCLEQVDNLMFFMEISLKSGKEVVLDGIGKLRIVDTKARNGRNPITGEKISISEGQALRFKKSTTFFKTTLTEMLTGDFKIKKYIRKTKEGE